MWATRGQSVIQKFFRVCAGLIRGLVGYLRRTVPYGEYSLAIVLPAIVKFNPELSLLNKNMPRKYICLCNRDQPSNVQQQRSFR